MASTRRKFARQQRRVQVQVGLDFGTSCSKIAYRVFGASGANVRAITATHGLNHLPLCCLPSVAAIDATGELLIGVPAARYLFDRQWDEGFRRFKVVVAGHYDHEFHDPYASGKFHEYAKRHAFDDPLTAEYLCAAYITYVMRKVRQVLRRGFESAELEVRFNVCIPIDHIENNPVRQAFQQILATAEVADRECPGSMSCRDLLDYCQAMYEKVHYSPDDPDCRVFAVPEAVAQVASYLVSLARQSGLHAIIDLGAGTSDVSIFNLMNVDTGDAASVWYASCNLPGGVYRVERLIADTITRNNQQHATPTDSSVTDALHSASGYSPELERLIKLQLDVLWQQSHSTWGNAYKHLRKQSAWMGDKVRVFVVGGGAALPYVEEVFSKSWMPGWGSYPTEKLPVPTNFDSKDKKAPFRRMAVAYGLTQAIPELGKFTLPKDAPDHTPPPLPRRELDLWILD